MYEGFNQADKWGDCRSRKRHATASRPDWENTGCFSFDGDVGLAGFSFVEHNPIATNEKGGVGCLGNRVNTILDDITRWCHSIRTAEWCHDLQIGFRHGGKRTVRLWSKDIVKRIRSRGDWTCLLRRSFNLHNAVADRLQIRDANSPGPQTSEQQRDVCWFLPTLNLLLTKEKPATAAVIVSTTYLAPNALRPSVIATAYDEFGVTHGYAIAGKNIVYDCHVYPWKSHWKHNFESAAKRIPLIFDEFGGTGKQLTFGRKVIAFAAAHHICWCSWSFHTQAGPVLIKNWHYQPSKFGALIKSALQSSDATGHKAATADGTGKQSDG